MEVQIFDDAAVQIRRLQIAKIALTLSAGNMQGLVNLMYTQACSP